MCDRTQCLAALGHIVYASEPKFSRFHTEDHSGNMEQMQRNEKSDNHEAYRGRWGVTDGA